MIKFYQLLGHSLFKYVYLDILRLNLEIIKHDNLVTEKYTEDGNSHGLLGLVMQHSVSSPLMKKLYQGTLISYLWALQIIFLTCSLLSCIPLHKESYFLFSLTTFPKREAHSFGDKNLQPRHSKDYRWYRS